MEKTNQTTVSILLPVYNAGPYLHACLNSILNQTFTNWELIAIDDGSTDDSLQILRQYSANDSRIHVYKNSKNYGIAYTLNRAIKHAKGQFLARMDADDIMLPHRLSLQIRYLKKHPNTVVLGGQCYVINQQGAPAGKKLFPLKHDQLYQLSYNRCPVQHPAIMINRRLVPQDFTWYRTSHIPAEDLELFFRLFRFGKFANLPQFVLKYRRHLTNSSLIDPVKTYRTAQSVRHLAVSAYGYRPSLLARLTNLFQRLIIAVLPTSLIYPLYLTLTGNSPRPLISQPNLKLAIGKLRA